MRKIALFLDSAGMRDDCRQTADRDRSFPAREDEIEPPNCLEPPAPPQSIKKRHAKR